MSRQILSKHKVHQHTITKSQIDKRVKELATAISQDFSGQKLLVVCILKGAFVFAADLIREIHRLNLVEVSIDFIQISSYGANTESSRSPIIRKDLDTDVAGRHILIVDDIIDTGHSLKFLHYLLSKRKPATLKTCVLTSKPSRKEVEVTVDYIGFVVEGWREGYGMDTDELGRGNPHLIRKD